MSSTPAEPSHVSQSDRQDAMKHYGIVEVPAHVFEYGGYRYTNIKDAIAAARRNPERVS
jgi:hypothetical protein